MPRRLKNILKFALILSLFIGLYGCQEVEFSPNITPLISGTIPPDQFLDKIPTQQSGFQLPADDMPLVVPGFSPGMALELCKEPLYWGDETLGMCLAPNGQYYFYWTSPDEVNIIYNDPQNPSLTNFREAVQERTKKINDAWKASKIAIPRAGGLFLSLVGLPFACSTVVGCLLDGAAVVVTAGLLANSAETIVDSINAAELAETRSRYYECLLQGNNDIRCREQTGIDDFKGEDND